MMRAASSFPDADREPTSQSERVNPNYCNRMSQGLTQPWRDSGMELSDRGWKHGLRKRDPFAGS
jgi:hypothetical protein